jgi:DNA polymerase-4
VRGHVVTLKVKYADFELVTRRVTLPRPTDDDQALFEAARALLARIDLRRPVRLTGVSVSGFAAAEEVSQLDLFGGGGRPEPPPEPGEERRRALNTALDALADRFGDGAVVRADLAPPTGRRRGR